MIDSFLKSLEASRYFSSFPIREICVCLKLQLIEEGHTLTICSDVFVIDIDSSTLKVDVLFVDENLNNLSEYLNFYFETSLKKRNFLLFYVFLRHFMKFENTDSDSTPRKRLKEDIEELSEEIQATNINENLLMRLDPIILYKSSCGENLLFLDRIMFCSCILSEKPIQESLGRELNIFTHYRINENITIKNEKFEIRENSFFYESERSPEMSYLWKNGLSAEEIFDCFGIDKK